MMKWLGIYKNKSHLTNIIRSLRDNNNMKKFNGWEHSFLSEALEHHINNCEAEVRQSIKAGNRPIFAEGFFSLMGGELMEKLDDMTLKSHLKH